MTNIPKESLLRLDKYLEEINVKEKRKQKSRMIFFTCFLISLFILLSTLVIFDLSRLPNLSLQHTKVNHLPRFSNTMVKHLSIQQISDKGSNLKPDNHTFFPQLIHGANPSLSSNHLPEFMLVSDEMPHFPGGKHALYEYISKNINYPKAAEKNKIEGKVHLRFIIMADGSISNIDVVKSLGYGCDEEAIRLLRSMPKWEAGKQGETHVNVLSSMMIAFRLKR